MNKLEDVKYGWNFMSHIMEADYLSKKAFSDYVFNLVQNEEIKTQNIRIDEINKAIDLLAKNINEHPHINLNVEQFKGFVAEEMHAQTFNIDALKKGSMHRAWTLQDNGYGSIDVTTNFGKNYSLKYSNTAKDAENMQAALNPETRMSKYEGQERLIASDQIDEAKFWAHKRGIKDINNRPDVSKSHFETEKHMVSKITDGDGVESRELTIKESKQIAREAKKGEFDPEKYGYAKEAVLDEVQLDYINKAFEAGLTAATITAILQIVPEIYKAVDYLIKNGEINLNQIKKTGVNIITSSGESFLRGAIAYSVEMAIQNGLLGESLKHVNPSVVGVAVTVILSTIKDSLFVAAGKMTCKEMGIHFTDTLIVSSGYLVGMKIGGTITQILCPNLPVISYAIGSLIGCSVSVVYNIGKNKLISYCVDSGFACFGLVEQNYQLPEDVLKSLNVHIIPIERSTVTRTDINSIKTNTSINSIMIDTIDIIVLKRGIIGINKVGYIV